MQRVSVLNLQIEQEFRPVLPRQGFACRILEHLIAKAAKQHRYDHHALITGKRVPSCRKS
jgi:hypothetical protein